MTLTELKQSLINALSASYEFIEGQEERILHIAARELARVKRRVLTDTLMLIPGRTFYDAPEDLIEVKISDWGLQQKRILKPWQVDYPSQLPDIIVVNTSPKQLKLSYVPQYSQIQSMGEEMLYQYYATHRLSENKSETTVPDDQQDLLILRAQAEAMKILSARFAGSTATAKSTISGIPKIGTPAALYHMLMKEFRSMAVC